MAFAASPQGLHTAFGAIVARSAALFRTHPARLALRAIFSSRHATDRPGRAAEAMRAPNGGLVCASGAGDGGAHSRATARKSTVTGMCGSVRGVRKCVDMI